MYSVSVRMYVCNPKSAQLALPVRAGMPLQLRPGGCRALVQREHHQQVQRDRVQDEGRPCASVAQDRACEHKHTPFEDVQGLVCPRCFL